MWLSINDSDSNENKKIRKGIKKRLIWASHELYGIFDVFFRNTKKWLHVADIAKQTGIRKERVCEYVEKLQKTGWLQFRLNERDESVYSLRFGVLKLKKELKENFLKFVFEFFSAHHSVCFDE